MPSSAVSSCRYLLLTPCAKSPKSPSVEKQYEGDLDDCGKADIVNQVRRCIGDDSSDPKRRSSAAPTSPPLSIATMPRVQLSRPITGPSCCCRYIFPILQQKPRSTAAHDDWGWWPGSWKLGHAVAVSTLLLFLAQLVTRAEHTRTYITVASDGDKELCMKGSVVP